MDGLCSTIVNCFFCLLTRCGLLSSSPELFQTIPATPRRTPEEQHCFALFHGTHAVCKPASIPLLPSEYWRLFFSRFYDNFFPFSLLYLNLCRISSGWKASTEQQLADLEQNTSFDKADVMLAEQYSAAKQSLERIREAASSIFEQYLTEQVRLLHLFDGRLKFPMNVHTLNWVQDWLNGILPEILRKSVK